VLDQRRIICRVVFPVLDAICLRIRFMHKQTLRQAETHPKVDVVGSAIDNTHLCGTWSRHTFSTSSSSYRTVWLLVETWYPVTVPRYQALSSSQNTWMHASKVSIIDTIHKAGKA